MICSPFMRTESPFWKKGRKRNYVLSEGWFDRWVFLSIFSLFMAQHPISGPGRFIVDVSRWHTIRQKHKKTVRLLWTSDQLVAEAAVCITHNKHKKRTFMPAAWSEVVTPAIERLQTYALDLVTTGISLIDTQLRRILWVFVGLQKFISNGVKNIFT
jgi:hypothetical protein